MHIALQFDCFPLRVISIGMCVATSNGKLRDLNMWGFIFLLFSHVHSEVAAGRPSAVQDSIRDLCLFSVILGVGLRPTFVTSGVRNGHHSSEHQACMEERKGSSSYTSSLLLEKKAFPRTHPCPHTSRLPLTPRWLGACPTTIPRYKVASAYRGARAALTPGCCGSVCIQKRCSQLPALWAWTVQGLPSVQF